ncbi:hypothetical protein AVEN_190947-1 [Araneus ventricosus]|uniref:Reverse transcriptase Ty1/copia-type domain-containing protein n=1 Tax=Araneus ventricosus TaxID=182803 RepID=A0A4Y2JFN1_ARAVE|nr:hypothetical protein AVEN_190947-1 [Araneus ventricosus]
MRSCRIRSKQVLASPVGTVMVMWLFGPIADDGQHPCNRLKQAPKCWNQKFKYFLQKCNLEQTNSDPCLFVNKDKYIFLILCVYDGIIAAKDEEKLQEFLKNLEETFSARIEPANYYKYSILDDGSFFILQEKIIAGKF